MQTTTEKINFLVKCFGENYRLSKNGSNIAVSCPNCNSDPSKLKLSICLESWVCHCWVCGIKGKSPYHIIKKHVSNQQAEFFRQNFKIENLKVDIKDNTDIVTFPSNFRMFAAMTNIYDPDVKDCLRYLKSRGVTQEQLWQHKIGYFSGRMWSRRVVFPSFDKQQNLNFYVTRAIDDDVFMKYKNCKADKINIVFDEMRIDWSKELMIVEGVFDMIKCPANTVCLLGSSLSIHHALFKKIVANKTPVVLALDNDATSKAFKIAKELTNYGIRVRMFESSNFSDIGCMTKELVRQKYEAAPTYTREASLLHKIGTICSGSIF